MIAIKNGAQTDIAEMESIAFIGTSGRGFSYTDLQSRNETRISAVRALVPTQARAATGYFCLKFVTRG